MIKIANAPVSYGAFEVTVGIDDNVPTATEVLDAVQAAGYDGIDLGPLGYLGLGDELRRALESRNLLLAGGYVEIDVSNERSGEVGFAELERVCEQFRLVSNGLDRALLPRPTVALVAREARPANEEPSASWSRVERTLHRLVEECRTQGFEPCLHNEVGTEIATEETIERALASTDVSVCLDTGHLLAAGGDPVGLLERWSKRVQHVHIKDAKVPEGVRYEDAKKLWRDSVFCALGAGTAPIDDVLRLLKAKGYSGWVVVEQDVLPRDRASYERACYDQEQNRRYLRERGW